MSGVRLAPDLALGCIFVSLAEMFWTVVYKKTTEHAKEEPPMRKQRSTFKSNLNQPVRGFPLLSECPPPPTYTNLSVALFSAVSVRFRISVNMPLISNATKYDEKTQMFALMGQCHIWITFSIHIHTEMSVLTRLIPMARRPGREAAAGVWILAQPPVQWRPAPATARSSRGPLVIISWASLI